MREWERERENRDSETGRVSRREGKKLAAYITRAMADDVTSNIESPNERVQKLTDVADRRNCEATHHVDLPR